MSATAASVPERQRVYAVGDIHGRIDLLTRLQDAIIADAADATGLELTAIYLGDYVDRGSDSFAVVDRLANAPLAGFTTIHLRGNHEEMMLGFLAGPPQPMWLMNGGIAALESYGVPFGWYDLDAAVLADLQQRLAAVVPESHHRFFSNLQLTFSCGDYFFVHAGVRPGRPLELQDRRDLLWIRAPFLSTGKDFGKRVVHGHTIVRQPDVKPNRIGIDTGAFHTGCLTCLVLEGTAVRFLHT